MEQKRQSVLVVDDAPDSVEALNQQLSESYDVDLVESGEAALEAMRERSYDIVLLDVMLPGADGYETLRRMKADPRMARIPVVFISGLAHLDSQLKGLDLGAVDYVIKPYDIRLIKLRVRNILEHQRHRDLLAERTAKLERALAEVKRLQGLLPICAWCKRIRNDEGFWTSIDDYLHTHTDAEITHGICPQCSASVLDG